MTSRPSIDDDFDLTGFVVVRAGRVKARAASSREAYDLMTFAKGEFVLTARQFHQRYVAEPATTDGGYLHVLNKDNEPVGRVKVALGVKTYAGEIVRFTEHSIWTCKDGGPQRMHRRHDGRLPGVYQSYAGKFERGLSPGGVALEPRT